jgi:hypothetical protein
MKTETDDAGMTLTRRQSKILLDLLLSYGEAKAESANAGRDPCSSAHDRKADLAIAIADRTMSLWLGIAESGHDARCAELEKLRIELANSAPMEPLGEPWKRRPARASRPANRPAKRGARK